MRRFFQFEELGTNYRREVVAGVTTFLTMAYIIVVNPAILYPAVDKDIVLRATGSTDPAGIVPILVVCTILTAVVGTLITGLYAKRPFAQAPYMGENAFVAAVVVGTLGFSWRAALAGVLISGVLITVVALCRLRAWLANAVPTNLKFAFVVGIGLFLTFIGLTDSGIVVAGPHGGPPVAMGQMKSPQVLLAAFCLVLMGVLMVRRVPGAILIAILGTAFAGMVTTALGWTPGLTPFPKDIVKLPPSPLPIFCKFDFSAILDVRFFPVFPCLFLMDFLDPLGTLIGLSAKAGFLDKEGNLPDIQKPVLADALATVVGALFGITTTGHYIESAAGIEAGGRSGFTAVVTALCFAGALVFWPLAVAIPVYAYGPALIMVGILMMESVTRLNFQDMTELIPAFATVVLMSFTFNIGVGMTAGFVLYPLMKVITGRVQEVPKGMWVLSALSVAFFALYPHA